MIATAKNWIIEKQLFLSPFGLIFTFLINLTFLNPSNINGQDFKQAKIKEGVQTNNTIINTSVKNIAGKSYLNWIVQGQKENCLFVIFKSLDGIHYELLNFKQGVGTNVNVPLLYCYTDSCATADIQYYKIKTFNLADVNESSISVLTEHSSLDLTEIVSLNTENITPYKISFLNTRGDQELSAFLCDRKEENHHLNKPDSLTSGVYLLAVSVEENIEFKKIIIP